MSNETFGNLLSSMHLCLSVKVLLTLNHLNACLSNGSIRIVKEIAHENDKLALALPKFIIVNFRKSCIGQSFFPCDVDKKDNF